MLVRWNYPEIKISEDQKHDWLPSGFLVTDENTGTQLRKWFFQFDLPFQRTNCTWSKKHSNTTQESKNLKALHGRWKHIVSYIERKLNQVRPRHHVDPGAIVGLWLCACVAYKKEKKREVHLFKFFTYLLLFC